MNFLTPKQQLWRSKWPAGIIALLATVQLILTATIVGLESLSFAIDNYHSMIFAGFYCSFIFTIAWISMFTVTCCNRHSFGCATHVLVENILSIIAAAVLLYFDNLFLNNPYTCLYGSIYDCDFYSSSFSSYYGIYDSSSYTIKLACIKAQLACASVILFTNVIYIIIFIIVTIKTRNEIATYPINPIPQPAPYVIPTNQESLTPQQRTVQCPACLRSFQLA